MEKQHFKVMAARPSGKTAQTVLTGLLFAAALVLSYIESTLPPLPIPVPGVKMGLSNIVVMVSLFFLNGRIAFAIALLKALFVCFVQGIVAGFLSLCGGVLSVSVMALLIAGLGKGISYFGVSVSGAVFHNIGQFLGVCILYANMNLWVYLPVLVLSGIGAGALTATLLRFVLPALKKTGLT